MGRLDPHFRQRLALILVAAALGLIPISFAWAEPSAFPTPTVESTMTPTPTIASTPLPTLVPTARPTFIPSATPSRSAEPNPSTATMREKAALIDVGYEMECADDDGSGWVRISGDYDRFDGRDLTWVLHGPAGVDRSGELEWWDDQDWYPPLDFDIPIGHYRIVVTLVGEARVVTDSEFDIAGCVRIEPDCHGATFTNPARNPAARVTYTSTGDDWVPPEGSDLSGELILQPGESRWVEILHMEISGQAHAPADQSTSQWPNAGEFFSETIEQHCGPTMTHGTISCAASGRGIVEAVVSPPDDRGVRYRIIDPYEDGVADSGRVGADGRVRSELPAGSYLFRSYTSAKVLPYDQAWFVVSSCVTAAAKCHAVRFVNPSDETVVIEYRTDDKNQTGTVPLKSGKAKTVPVSPGTLTWRGAAYEADKSWKIEPGGGSIRIDPNCSSLDHRTDDRSRNRERLPATGSPAPWWVGLVGLAATAPGLALILRPRRRR